MKILLVTFICFLAILGCEKNDHTIITGVVGTVDYGHADCMPNPDGTQIAFNRYSGILYFIKKRDFDNLGNGDFDKLKMNSIKTKIENGTLGMELPVDTFLVIPNVVYHFSEDNMIIIKQGIVLEKDFKFWRCTSF